MDLTTLNTQQKEAVLAGDGALLILAGAGSGKTRVLTQRIARLIQDEDVAPWRILAFTFTNKAAAEMKSRIAKELDRPVDAMWIGTFHSICSRLLRREIEPLGYTSGFTIYDTSDQKSLVKMAMKELLINTENYTPQTFLSMISKAKNDGRTPEIVEKEASGDAEKAFSRVYKRYERIKKENNALDFDDLILLTLELLHRYPEVLEKYRRQFRYVFVDEYQDTNRPQYELIRAFAGDEGNICCVGDADQSIYGWRGADIRNILDFTKDYPKARTILLEQNYRSTEKILSAANALIKKNENRVDKTLWTEKGAGEDITYKRFPNEFEEAQAVSDWIYSEHRAGFGYGQMAVLYRTNAQSRPIEEALVRSGVPYRIIGGLKFYDRAEIKDLVSYMNLAVNPLDDVAFLRVVNQPKRGIGQTTLNKLQDMIAGTGLSLLGALHEPEMLHAFNSGTRQKLESFRDFADGLAIKAEAEPILEFVKSVYNDSGYRQMLESKPDVENLSRMENVDAFFNAVAQYQSESEEASLIDYLQNLSLMSDLDKASESGETVSLMTIHSAKGLEFPVVFITGLEDGLFPSRMTMDEGNLEEERRLFYVAITRAEEKLYMTGASTRRMYGDMKMQMPSRFLKELDGTVALGEDEDDMLLPGSSYEGAGQRFRSPKLSDPAVRKSYDEQREKMRKLVEERKAAAAKGSGCAFRAGDKVTHKRFGKGTVVQVVPMEGGDEITVAFDKKGIKRLNAALAPLTKE